MDRKILRQILDELYEIKDSILTKEDALNFLTKSDAKNFATKDDLKQAMANYPTKDDLKQALANYPTKVNLDNALKEQAKDFGDVVNELITSLDEKKADVGTVSKLEKRIIRVESKFAA